MKKMLGYVLSLMVLAILVSSCYREWESAGFSGRIVNARDGEPVSGAIVVAHWDLVGPNEGYPRGQLAVIETITDAEGRYQIHGWGPRRVSGAGRVRGDAPLVHIFKHGFVPVVLTNIGPGYTGDRMLAPPRIISRLDGQTIQLIPFEGSNREYASLLDAFYVRMYYLVMQPCNWNSAPEMFAALSSLGKQFSAQDIRSSLPNIDGLCKRDKDEDVYQ